MAESSELEQLIQNEIESGRLIRVESYGLPLYNCVCGAERLQRYSIRSHLQSNNHVNYFVSINGSFGHPVDRNEPSVSPQGSADNPIVIDSPSSPSGLSFQFQADRALAFPMAHLPFGERRINFNFDRASDENNENQSQRVLRFFSNNRPIPLPLPPAENNEEEMPPPPPLERQNAQGDGSSYFNPSFFNNIVDANGEIPFPTPQRRRFLFDIDRQGDTQFFRKPTEERYQTIFIESVALGDLELVCMMVERGAIVDDRLNDNMTPLIVATRKKFPDMVELLLNMGANPSLKDKLGKTALMYAKQDNNEVIINLLIDADINITKKSEECDICRDKKEFFYRCGTCSHEICLECQDRLDRHRCPFCRTNY